MITDAAFSSWIKGDNADRVVLVEMDYQHEESGAPVTETLRFATKPYFDDVRGLAYRDCVNSAPQFSRALSGERLGDYKSTLGSIEIDNADGDFDDLLRWAIDGSEVRCYLGDASWARDEFRLIFAAMSTLAKATSIDRISVQLKDAATLLNVSIGGTVLVGGTGTNAAKERAANFGWLHQIECPVLDQTALVYVHSDRGDNTVIVTVRDRGVDITSNASDNGDGTFTLSATPDGTVTADVLAVAPGSAPGDYTQRRMSDAFAAFIGDRAGFSLAGRYLGAGPTYSAGDDDDYFVGISLPQATNVLSLLSQMADSGNCFWAITRGGLFTFGRLNPQDVASLGTVPVEIGEDDVDYGSVKIDHAQPLYYKFQAVINKNWSIQSDLATSLTPDQRAGFLNAGINVVQDDSVGTLYADSPELYDLTLAVSPVIMTLVSAGYDEDATAIITEWMERRRFMYLPWIETITMTVGIEFYALELGDVVNFTFPRFGCDGGVLFQVVGINIDLTKAKITLQLLRRHEAEAIPDGWARDTTDEAPLDIGFAVASVAPPEPPGIPQPPKPVIWQSSWYPGNLPGIGGFGASFAPFEPNSGGGGPFLLDNFTGASVGLIAGHAADTGQTWANYASDFKYPSGNPTNIKLDGSGFVGVDTDGDSAFVLSSAIPASADYYVEIKVRGTDALQQSCAFNIRSATDSGDAYQVTTFPVDATHAHVEFYRNKGVGTFYGPGDAIAVPDGQNYTVRITARGSTLRLFVAGLLRHTQADATLPVDSDMSLHNRIAFYLNPSGGTYAAIGLDYIKADYLSAVTTLYNDTFSGTGDLGTHLPDVGGAYTLDGGASASAYVLGGSGGVPSQSVTHVDAFSALTSSPSDSYVLTADVSITALGADTLELDFSATVVSPSDYIAEAFLQWSGSAWTLEAFVDNGSGTVIYDSGAIDVTTKLAVGDHTLTVYVTSSGTTWQIDGVLIATTSTVPPVAPTHVGFENHKGGATSNVTVNSFSLTVE